MSSRAVIEQHDRTYGGSNRSLAGASPAARLAATPGVQRVPTRELELFIVRDFLDADACAALIERIDERRRPSEIADDVGIANFRTSETCDLDWRDPVVGEVDRKIAALLGLPLAASEPIQGQRYAPGQEFKPHTDTFEPGGYDFYRPHRRDAASGRGPR